jgi:PAS domain S-box-containing protein
MPEESNSLLNVLSLEDDLKDAELLHEMLVDADYQVSMDIAKGEKEYVDFLKGRNYDIIFADNSVTSFDAMAALKVALSLKPEIPFICVSGTIGEEKAVELLKQGASDYVIKDRLNRLAFAVQRALKEKEIQKASKQAERALKNSEDKYSKAFQSSPYSITISRLEDGGYIEVNDTFVSMSGFTRKEALSNTTIGLNIWVNKEERNSVISALLSGKDVEGKEFLFRKKNGEIMTGLFSAKIIYVNEEPYMLSSVDDITKRKKSENLLMESEQKSKSIMENSADAIFLTNQQGRYVYINKAVTAMLGYTSEEMINKTIADISPPDKIEEYFKFFKQIMNEGKGFTEIELLKKDGNYISTDLNTVVLPDGTVYGSCGDITERKQAESELIKAKEKAEESDRLKSAFLTNMSHEIRTPMNGILGFAELLKRPNLTGEKQQQFLRLIGESGERMLETINNIIDISKIEAGLMSVYISESNINKQIEFLHEFFKPMAESKGLQLSFNNGLPSNEAIIKTDSGKINSILTNLVKNAIKFTDAGSIEFGYKKKGKYLEFFVKDTGIGIPKDRQDAIFERFIQADIEDKRAFQGSGLGLSISKKYVELHDGEIWVESKEGLGSTFYFTIPYNAISVDKNVIGNAVSEIEEVQIKNLKILIAEDEEVSDLFITEALQEISHKIIHAETGVEAIEACRNNPDLDLILMDIRMPEMDGLEATRQIRLFNTDVIIIAQTAYAFVSDRKNVLEAGCNDYISKPINMTLLLELIKKHVNK